MRFSKSLILSLMLASCAFAEMHGAMLMTLPLSIGNTGREYRLEDGAPFVLLRSKKTGNYCSGTVIDNGCILTAGHCNEDDFQVFAGQDEKTAILVGESDPEQNVSLGDGKKGKDVRIFRMKYPLPFNQLSITRDELATERLTVDMTNDEKSVFGSGISWGPNASQTVQKKVEFDIPGSDKVDSVKLDFTEDIGHEVRRQANVRIRGYGDLKDKAALGGNAIKTTGDVLWASRGPQIFVRGDSGVLLKYEGKYHGILSVAGLTGKMTTLPNEAIARNKPGQVFANDVMSNQFTPIPDVRKDIIAALDKLKCQEHTSQAHLLKVQEIVKGEAKRLGTNFSWDKMHADETKAINEHLRQIAGIADAAKLSVSHVERDGHHLKFRLNWKEPKQKKQSTDLEISLAS